MKAFIAVVVLATTLCLASTGPAEAQTCVPYSEVERVLTSDNYQEEIRVVAFAGGGDVLVQFWASENETGTWSIVVVNRHTQIACMPIIGEGYAIIEDPEYPVDDEGS